jgi:hypothetical protein
MLTTNLRRGHSLKRLAWLALEVQLPPTATRAQISEAIESLSDESRKTMLRQRLACIPTLETGR